MDIDILLGLQGARESAPDILTALLSGLSFVADGPGLVAIVMVVYWCVHKRAGQFAMMAFMTGNLTTQFVKNLACVYRPWVRDARVVPPESVIEGAGGYSFPSGHTSGAVTSLGSFAWLARQRSRILSIVLVVIVALIAFSRLYFGVHTPQDVLIGLAIGVFSIWAAARFFRWIEDNGDKDILVAGIAIAVSVITTAIVAVKGYPMDYVGGQLLVNPVDMQKGSFEAAGVVIGVALGWVFERRRVQFSTDAAAIDVRGRLIRAIVGIVIVGVVYLAGNALFKAIFGVLVGKLVAMALLTFVAFFVVPLVFTWLEQTRFVPYADAAPARRARARGAQAGRTATRRAQTSRGSASRASQRRSQTSRASSSAHRQRDRRTDEHPTSSAAGRSQARSGRGAAREAPEAPEAPEVPAVPDALEVSETPDAAEGVQRSERARSLTIPEISPDAPDEERAARPLDLPKI